VHTRAKAMSAQANNDGDQAFATAGHAASAMVRTCLRDSLADSELHASLPRVAESEKAPAALRS
jgi:hypothetical protein